MGLRFFLLLAAVWRAAALLSGVATHAGKALKIGLKAEATVLHFFEIGDVEGGFAAMGPELLAAVRSFDADLNTLPEYPIFEQRWNGTLRALSTRFADDVT